MATKPSSMLVHGASARRLSPEEAETVAANLGLIDWTIRRYCRNWITHTYTYDDAWQDGWFGLCAAVTRWDPDLGSLSTIARRTIGHSIRHGAGIAGGINRRRVIAGRVRFDDPTAGFEISLDHLIGAPDDSPSTLGEQLPADVDVEAAALTTVLAAAATATGRAACTDHIDRAVLASILDPAQPQASDDIADQLRAAGSPTRSGAAIRLRRLRLLEIMRRSVA